MAVSIEQIDAQVEPAAPPQVAAATPTKSDEPETELRRQRDLLTRLARRDARLRAD